MRRTPLPRKLRPPTTLINADGSCSLVWVIPHHDLAERFIDLLWDEAQIHGAAKVVDRDEAVVNAEYPAEKGNHVVFACWLLNEFYRTYLSLEKCLELECEE
jgi:hypothetical protein